MDVLKQHNGAIPKTRRQFGLQGATGGAVRYVKIGKYTNGFGRSWISKGSISLFALLKFQWKKISSRWFNYKED